MTRQRKVALSLVTVVPEPAPAPPEDPWISFWAQPPLDEPFTPRHGFTCPCDTCAPF